MVYSGKAYENGRKWMMTGGTPISGNLHIGKSLEIEGLIGNMGAMESETGPE